MVRYYLNFLLAILPPSRLFGIRRILLRLGGVRVASEASFCGGGWIYGRGELHIGEYTWLSPGVVFYTHLDASISIGDRCDIGPNVKFVTGSHAIGSASRRAGTGTAKSIVIGDGSWIGAGAQIMGGVRIGSGSIVAAGAVVTRDVGPNVLVAGVPAVFKKNLDS